MSKQKLVKLANKLKIHLREIRWAEKELTKYTEALLEHFIYDSAPGLNPKSQRKSQEK